MEREYDFDKVLSHESQALAQRRSELERQADALMVELEQVRRRQQLVSALLQASGPTQDVNGPSEANGQSADGNWMEDGSRLAVGDIAHSILLARGQRPMYYEELAAAVQRAGGRLGGRSPGQTLVARISRDPRFVRPEKRGWYAAKEFFPNHSSVGTRKPGARRKKRQRP